MALKVGDTVRYLNAVGGGKVTRISGDIAYVDEDGFETPVLVRECVVVGTALSTAGVPDSAKAAKTAPSKTPRVATKEVIEEPTRLPVIETATGNSLNLSIGFEPTDIKALSTSDFDAYIVNDSNYYIYVAVMSRSTDEHEWHHLYDGLIEPNIEEYAFTLEQAVLPAFDRLAVEYIAFKRDRIFEAKEPVFHELRVEASKFAKLHCFKAGTYFDRPVIAYDIVANDRSVKEIKIDPEKLQRSMQQKQHTEKPAAHVSKPSEKRANSDIIEVDLHASELFDSTNGLSPADILNRQIDRFTEVMLANERRIGQKIVFIHGKGEGVLRQALMKELNNRFKGHDVQDASFAEYGFGATQVIIKKQLPQSKNGQRRR